MRTIAHAHIVLLVFVASQAFAANSTYEFATDDFQLGRWSPAKLSFESGLSKIHSLDQWFSALKPGAKEKYYEDYTLNRNRLFLVTQEKRIESELQSFKSALSTGVLRSETEVASRRDRSTQLRSVQAISERLLDNPEALKKSVFTNLGDAQVLAIASGGDETLGGRSRFSIGESISKGGGGGQLSLPSVSTVRDYKPVDDGRLPADSLVPVNVKPKNGFASSVCSEPGGSLGDDLDARKNPETSRMLNELGISKELSADKSKSLASWFPEYQTQWLSGGRKNQMCGGYALANDVSATLYRRKTLKLGHLYKAKGISAEHAYAAALVAEESPSTPRDPNKEGYCDPKSYPSDLNAGMDMKSALSAFQSVPLCERSATQLMTSKYRIDKFSVAEFRGSDRRPSFDFFKALIDAGQPPIIAIDSDKRTEVANWLRIENSGSSSHVLNLVGYDEVLDPMTLCRSKVFIVRDSLGKKKTEYYVSAQNLIAHLQGVYRTTEVTDADGSSLPHAPKTPATRLNTTEK